MTEGSRHDYQWDQEKLGYHVTTDGKPIHFYPAKSQFNRSEADEAAKTHARKLHTDEVKAARANHEHDIQMNKPLSEVEKRWAELDKKLIHSVRHGGEFTDDDHNKYQLYGGAVRKSLLNHSHPAMEHRKK